MPPNFSDNLPRLGWHFLTNVEIFPDILKKLCIFYLILPLRPHKKNCLGRLLGTQAVLAFFLYGKPFLLPLIHANFTL